MKESFLRYWHYYLAALLLAMGIFFMGKAHACEDNVDIMKNLAWTDCDFLCH